MRVMSQIDMDIATHEQVQVAVVVVIQKGGAGTEVRPRMPIGMVRQTGAGGNIDKAPASLAVAHVMVEDVRLAVAGDEQVGKAVVVDVANRHAHTAAD